MLICFLPASEVNEIVLPNHKVGKAELSGLEKLYIPLPRYKTFSWHYKKYYISSILGFFCLFCFCLFVISWAAPAAYGGSQARGLIKAVAASLCQSHSNAGSEPRLQPTPQATLDP